MHTCVPTVCMYIHTYAYYCTAEESVQPLQGILQEIPTVSDVVCLLYMCHYSDHVIIFS